MIAGCTLSRGGVMLVLQALLLIAVTPTFLGFPLSSTRAPRNAFPTRRATTLVPLLSTFSADAGESALRQVKLIAGKVAESTEPASYDGNKIIGKDDCWQVRGTGGTVYNNEQYNTYMDEDAEESILRPNLEIETNSRREEQVWTALANLELDMQLLDKVAGQKPQLTLLELTMLSGSVFAAASGPFLFGGRLTEFMAPAAAAFSAAIGIGAEYVGRVAVADGKEVAALTIQCSAEAEGLLANAERAKAITPVCVGVCATAATISLLVPVLLTSMGTVDRAFLGELYLACPLISVLSAAVSSLALQDTKLFSARAISVGNRRFARSGLIGRTWLSSQEQVTRKSNSGRTKWRTFVFSVIPAPIVGSIVPGVTLATKAIIIASLGAAQAAFILAQCEYSVARASDAVALKARSAAVCDTYANQGSRSASILPFTSALSGLCAAATAAIVELPFLESLAAAGSVGGMVGESALVSLFPAFSSLFAAAASVSKARCEVQSEAAVQAAGTLALEYNNGDDEDPILRPFRGVYELIQLSWSNSVWERTQRLYARWTSRINRWRQRLFKGGRR